MWPKIVSHQVFMSVSFTRKLTLNLDASTAIVDPRSGHLKTKYSIYTSLIRGFHSQARSRKIPRVFTLVT